MEITKESVPGSPWNGHQVVGTTPARLTSLDFRVLKGVLIRCPGSEDAGTPNTAPVWVGGGGVTPDNSASGGMPVLPGDSIFIPVERPMDVYVVSTDPDQDVAWISV